MALSAAGLKTAIANELDTTYGEAEDADSRDKFCEALATAIIDYIKANAVVNLSSATAGGDPVLGTGTVT